MPRIWLKKRCLNWSPDLLSCQDSSELSDSLDPKHKLFGKFNPGLSVNDLGTIRKRRISIGSCFVRQLVIS